MSFMLDSSATNKEINQVQDRLITWHLEKHPRFLQKTRCAQDDSDFAARISSKELLYLKMAAIATNLVVF